MRTVLVCLVAICFVGCGKQSATTTNALKPESKEQVSNNLARDVEGIRTSMLRLDHARMADLSHPKLVIQMGGKDKYVKRLNEMAAEFKNDGFNMYDMKLSTPAEIAEQGSEYYSVVPYTLFMSGPENKKCELPTYLIGHSTDWGGSWKFIDGSGIAGDRKKLKMVIPNFPDSLALPVLREPIWK